LDVIGESTRAVPNAPRITFTGPIDLVLTGSVADDVIAVVREGLANVARHAHAEHAVVDVTVSETAITVAIDDDGDGIRPEAARTGGTANLLHRAQNRGGEFSLESRQGGGSRLEWCVPLRT
jgi:signal transduction histidine kinase